MSSLFLRHYLIKIQILSNMKFANWPNTLNPTTLPNPINHPIIFFLIHNDARGSSRVNNVTGSKWFMTVIEDHTRITCAILMKKLVGKIFENLHKLIQNQFQTNIQVLNTNNVRAYFHHFFSIYLLNYGIVHQTSCVNSLQQNGIFERNNRNLMKVIRSLMLSNNVPNLYWVKLSSHQPTL